MRTLIYSLIAMIVLATDARAARQVRVYEANVSAQTEASVQAQSALRQVLVRATGARDAANDPALAGVLAQASHDVLGTLRADAVLVGYGDAVPNGGPWRWVLTGSGLNETWNGTLDDGVNGAADIFARNAVAFAAMPDQSLLVEIDGVPTLKEYARVSEIL